MADKGKGLLALMVGAPKPKGGGEASSSDAPADEKVSTVKDFFAAGKAGDFEEAALLFARLYELCAQHEDEEYADAEEDEDPVAE